jgi:hypothetical protein
MVCLPLVLLWAKYLLMAEDIEVLCNPTPSPPRSALLALRLSTLRSCSLKRSDVVIVMTSALQSVLEFLRLNNYATSMTPHNYVDG